MSESRREEKPRVVLAISHGLAGGFRPTAEDVISKLKDEGDFDSLRLKIVGKLKENVDLRNQLISEVKQSIALNQNGAENLKPRQLSDAIHQEIGTKIMQQISDELWKIIRSENGGMQDEIRETVETVYYKIVNPSSKDEDHVSTAGDPVSSIRDGNTSPASTSDRRLSCDSDPDVPPGFSLPDQAQAENCNPEENQEHHHGAVKEEPHQPNDEQGPPGFTHCVVNNQIFVGGSDEDPDVPPGFG